MTFQESRIDAALARLNLVETTNYRIKRLLLGMSVAVTTVFLLGLAAHDPGVLEAERFVLKDSQGRTRAALELSDDQPKFALYDSAET